MRMLVFIFMFATISLYGQQNFWKLVGPHGGVITTLTLSQNGDIYAGTERNGIFRSTDAGNTWENIGPVIGPKPDKQFVGFIGSVNSIAVVNNNEIYVGCYNGIFRTRDFGKNWEWLNTGFYLNLNFECYCIIALPNNIVVAGTNYGNLRSTDNGESWSEIQPYFRKPNFNCIYLSKDGILYAGIKNVTDISMDIWKSSDNGETWYSRGYPWQSKTTINTLLVDKDDYLIVATDAGTYKSKNPNGSWNLMAASPSPFPTNVNSLLIDNENNLFAGTDSGVFRYTGGQFINGEFIYWVQKSQMYVNSMITLNSGSIIVATDNGSFKTTNYGENWFESDSGLGSINYTISEIIFNNLGHVFVGTEWGGIYRSMDNGTTWKCVSAGKTLSVIYSLACNTNGDIYAGTLGGGYAFYKSTDNGETWQDLNLSSFYVRSIGCNSKGHIFISTSSAGILRSTNDGITWEPLNSFPKSNDIRLGINSQDHIFAKGYRDNLYRSTDYGNTWSKLFLPNTPLVIYDIAFGSNQTLYITSGTAYKSTDNGDNWTITHPIDDYFVYTLTVNQSGDLFLGLTTYDGIHYSKDAGNTWKVENNGLSNLYVKSIACSPYGYIFAGTEGGVFRSVNNTTSINNAGRIPDLYSLEQNFPNPFNPTTRIRFSIPYAKFVTLKVYDILGRIVATLVNEEKLPGYYEVKYDAMNYPSGVYFYRIQAGSFSQTKKFILVK